MSGYGYYPGCSAKGTAAGYEESLLAVFEALGLELTELPDWSCCGSTVFPSLDEYETAAVAGRNLAIAEREGRDLVAPCAGCWLALTKAQSKLARDPALRRAVTTALGDGETLFRDPVPVRHPLDVLITDLGPQALAERVTRPLHGIKVAPYYGCQLVRPYTAVAGDATDGPTSMDRLLEAAGAEIVDFQYKTACCGSGTTMVMPGLGAELVYKLTHEAERMGADVIAVACPLCQFNLEAYQQKSARKFHKTIEMPVLYFTQLLGMALGLSPRTLGLQRSIVKGHLAAVK